MVVYCGGRGSNINGLQLWLTRLLGLVVFLIFLCAMPVPANADSTLEKAQKTRVLGKDMGASFLTGMQDGSNRVQTTASATVLGSLEQLLTASIFAPADSSGQSYAEYYSFSKRIFSENIYFTHDGVLGASVGLAPVEVRVPVLVYPVGPLVLGVEGGVRFQAKVTGHAVPTIVIGMNELSNVKLLLEGDAEAAGFVDGYASLIALRGGVGGEVELIDAKADVDATFFFDGRKPKVVASGLAEFLSGRFFAFIDFFNILKFGWSSLWRYDLFNWRGFCFAGGKLSCPAPR